MRGSTPEEDRGIGCYTEGSITRVDPPGPGGSWGVTYAEGWGCGVSADLGVEPKVGDTFCTYGHFGRPFHGQALNGKLLWYKSEAEMQADHQAWVDDLNERRERDFERDRESLDAQYEALPWVLCKRIDRFRAANPRFRIEHESYEMFVCTQAAALAEWAEGQESPFNAIEVWEALDFDGQQSAVPAWSGDHSGNTHGCAIGLARTMVTSTERAAVMPGAMTPLVGSADYSDPSPR